MLNFIASNQVTPQLVSCLLAIDTRYSATHRLEIYHGTLFIEMLMS